MHHCTGGHYSGHPMPAATLPKHSVSHSFPKRAAGSANGAPLSSSSVCRWDMVAHFGKRQGALQVSWSSLPHILGNPQMPNCDAHGSRVQKKKELSIPCVYDGEASQTFWVDKRAALRRACSDSKLS